MNNSNNNNVYDTYHPTASATISRQAKTDITYYGTDDTDDA